MKVAVLDKSANKVEDYTLPFEPSYRDDIFKKAVFAELSHARQPTGADPKAGRRHSVEMSKKRRDYRGSYGRSASRTPRKVMWRRGRQMRFVGAFVAYAVGGRKAHPPKPEKNLLKDINNKEWLKAFMTGMSSAFDAQQVSKNGQRIPEQYPFVLDDSVEQLSKTKEVRDLFEQLGFGEELGRLDERKIRAGKGTMRNRKYRTKRGPLLVVSSLDAPLMKAAKNIRGLEVLTPEFLLVSDFGMSEKPGRAVVFTKGALNEIKEVVE